MTDHILAAYAEDVRLRIGPNGERPGGVSPVVNVTEIDAGVIFKDERVAVTAFRVPHGSWPQAFGFRFVTPDKTVVLSGDTSFAPAIAEQCNGCDYLVHENGIVGDGGAYFKAYHTSAEELAKLANAAKPKLLILSHQPAVNEEGVRVIRSLYSGRVVVANDLDVFD